LWNLEHNKTFLIRRELSRASRLTLEDNIKTHLQKKKGGKSEVGLDGYFNTIFMSVQAGYIWISINFAIRTTTRSYLVLFYNYKIIYSHLSEASNAL